MGLGLLTGVSLLTSVLHANAQTLTPQFNELILGFRATATPGQAVNLEVDLGNMSNFYGATPGATIPLTALAVQDLADAYGANWFTRTDLVWGAVSTTGRSAGTSDGHAPVATLWATRMDGQPAWNRSSSFAQKNASGTIEVMYSPGSAGTLYGATSTSNSSATAVIDATQTGSWSAQDLKTLGTSFGFFNPTIDNSVTNPAGGAVLSELYELQPSTSVGVPATLLGALILTPAGLSFQAAGNNPAPIIGVSGDLAFGNETTGITATATLTITNSGNATLTVSGISYPSGFSGAFSGTIAAGASTNITVTFTPIAVQSYGGTVTVNSDAASGTSTITTSGAGAAAPTPIIGVSGSLAFGNVTTGAIATATLTITNSGNATLTVSSISYPAGFSGAFSGTIAVGASTNITVTFAPDAVQSYGGTVTVNSDAASGTSTITASGAGAAAPTPIIGVSGSLAFGNVTTGAIATATLTITNSGNATLTVSSISYPAGFSGAFSGTIAVGASTNITVTFAPDAVQSYGGTVTVNSDAAGGTSTSTVSGAGAAAPTPIIGVSGSLSFGNVTIGAIATATLTVANSGNATLTVSSISYPLGFSGAFSGTIVAGASTNITVTFTPIAVQSYDGTVTVNSDASSGTSTISASGAGAAVPTAVIGVSGSLAFGNVITGAIATATLTITNSGNSTLTVNSISYPTGFGGAFSGAIAAGGSHAVTVTFAPMAVQSYGGTVTVNSDATGGASIISASGAGVAAISSNHQPVFFLGPLVNNAVLSNGTLFVVVAGEPAFFVASATDADGDPVSYYWNFGDGTTASGALASSTYSDCGPFHASAVASDGLSSNTAALTVSVPCQFSTNQPLKLQMNINFARTNKDTASLQGLVDLGPGFAPAGRTVLVDVGDAVLSFVLNTKGKGVNSFGNVQLSVQKKTDLVLVKAQFKNGTWRDPWAEYGLINTNSPKHGLAVSVPVIVVVGEESFMDERALTYTSKQGKSGKAK